MSHSTKKPFATPSRGPHRIALCITELERGGAEQQFVRLAIGLDRGRFEPHAYCLSSEGPLARPLREAGVPVTCLEVRSRWDLRVMKRLADELRVFQPQILQTFLFHANIAGRLAARRAGVPHVVSGIRVAEPRRWHLWLDRLTQRFVDRHVCVSKAVADYSRNVARLDSRKIVVIPNGIDAVRFADATPAELPIDTSPGGAPEIILFVGRLEEQKNPELLIDAFRLLSPSRPKARLVIVGTGSLEPSLRTRARDMDGRVLWLGHRDDVPGLLKAATCLALPSKWEGMPNVVLEALAAGLPVLACPAEGVRELLMDGKYGEIVTETTPAGLAASLGKVLDDMPQARQRAEEAQAFVTSCFAVDRVISEYQNFYGDVLNLR